MYPNYHFVVLSGIFFTLGGQFIALPIIIATLNEQGWAESTGSLAFSFSSAQLTSSLVLNYSTQKIVTPNQERTFARGLSITAASLSIMANGILWIGELWAFYIAMMIHGSLSSTFSIANSFLSRITATNPHKGFSRALAFKTPLSAMANYVAFLVDLRMGLLISTLFFLSSGVFLLFFQQTKNPKEEGQKQKTKGEEQTFHKVLPFLLAVGGLGTMCAQLAGNQLLPLTYDRSTVGAAMAAVTLGSGLLQHFLTTVANGPKNALAILIIRSTTILGLFFLFYLKQPGLGIIFWMVTATHNTLLSHAIHERAGARLSGSIISSTTWQIAGLLAGGMLWITSSETAFYWLFFLAVLSAVFAATLWPYHMLMEEKQERKEKEE